MTSTTWAGTLSVVVPVYGVMPDRLVRCVNSIDAGLSRADELSLVFDGPPDYDISSLALPSRTQVVVNPRRLGLVENWNRCFEVASGDAVHLMHADDEVDTEFYETVRFALGQAPGSAFAIAGRELEGTAHLDPETATRTLMARMRPPVGSTVYVRSTGRPIRFSPAYPYCPDEELLPKLARSGGMSVVPRRLYTEQASAGQARRSTWRQRDFVDVYWSARMTGVEDYTASVRAFARTETRWSIASVCAELIRRGEIDIARTHLAALRRLDRSSPARAEVMVATVLAASRFGPALLRGIDRARGRHG